MAMIIGKMQCTKTMAALARPPDIHVARRDQMRRRGYWLMGPMRIGAGIWAGRVTVVIWETFLRVFFVWGWLL